MSDIVERLKKQVLNAEAFGLDARADPDTLNDAIAQIQSQSAEIARLKGEVEHWLQFVSSHAKAQFPLPAPRGQNEVMTDIEAKAKLLTDAAMRTYQTHAERSAMRCALGDASSLCDALSYQAGNAGRIRGGYIKKRAREDALLIKQCADAI